MHSNFLHFDWKWNNRSVLKFNKQITRRIHVVRVGIVHTGRPTRMERYTCIWIKFGFWIYGQLYNSYYYYIIMFILNAMREKIRYYGTFQRLILYLLGVI